MKKLSSLAAVAAISLGQMAAAHAVDLTVAVGQTDESTMTYRLGAQFDFNRSWFQTSVGRLTGYWDAGYTYWEGDESTSNHSISLAPVFVYEFAGQSVKPYVEAGILHHLVRALVTFVDFGNSHAVNVKKNSISNWDIEFFL